MRGRKVGSSRVLRRLDPDVNVSAIPVLEPGYRLLGTADFTIIGDAPKSLVVFGSTRDMAHAYIAKAPRRQGPKECATEYVIGRIGRVLPVRVATCRLVRLKERELGDPDVRFLSRYFLRHGHEQLEHGVEIVATCFGMQAAAVEAETIDKEAERAVYSLDLIVEVLRKTAVDDQNFAQLRDGLARMVAFDALIGANDRHPKNWGVIHPVLQKGPPRFSPIFDTARGLFWNHSDEQLRGKVESGAEGFLEGYAESSAPVIGVTGHRDANHFAVVAHGVKKLGPEFRDAVRHVVNAFRPDLIRALLTSQFGNLLSPLRLGLIYRLLLKRHQRLAGICGH